MIRARCALLILVSAMALAQGPYTISGVIVQANTSQPLNRAEVSIADVVNRGSQVSFVTASDGRFNFPNVPAGKYSLTAKWHAMSEFFHGHEQFSTAVVTGPGLDSQQVVFPFIMPGTISVSVQDQEGDPVRVAVVMLFRKRVTFGWARTEMTQQVNTNTSGISRFAHLAPGEYFVCVQARPWYAEGMTPAQGEADPQSSMRSQFDVAYPVTYSGDSLSAESASPVRIAQGDSAEVHITLRAVPALHLEMLETSPRAPEAENQSSSFAPNVSAVGPGGLMLNVPAMGGYSANGRQGITGLAPGRYFLSLEMFRNEGGVGRQVSLGAQEMDLAADITINPAELVKTTVVGKVRLDAGGPANIPQAIWLVNLAGVQAIELTATQQAIRPGRYVLETPNAVDRYIKSVSVKGAEYNAGIVSVQQGANIQVSAVIASGTTKIDGVALKEGKPFGGAMILLLPNDLSRSRYIPRDQSDSDGSFTLPNVPPGHYTAIAIDDGHGLAYQDGAVIRPYLAGGQAFDVPSPAKSLQIKVVHRLQ